MGNFTSLSTGYASVAGSLFVQHLWWRDFFQRYNIGLDYLDSVPAKALPAVNLHRTFLYEDLPVNSVLLEHSNVNKE